MEAAGLWPGEQLLRRFATTFLLAALVMAAAQAADQAPPLFRLPLACEPGVSCWIANHVDLDPGPAAQDYTCGQLTYNGHNGTDFAIRDLRAMTEGVSVVAAAAGKVAAVRDGEPDVSIRERGREAVKDRECGNGVRVTHGNGWQTQYCHLRRGSIIVKSGEAVSSGQPLALVGLSGETEYPHLHFVVRRDRLVVDPFLGEAAGQGCNVAGKPLWTVETRRTLPYSPGSLYNYGVARIPPKPKEAREGALRDRTLPADAPVFGVWAEVFGVDAGDMLEIQVEAPDGSILMERRMPVKERQAWIFRTIGRKRGAALWPPGEYRVRISLARAAGSAHGASSASFIALVR
jgi:murein DD-endopeptidase MepM/ murein hydrolase activator NlpD